MGFELGVVEGYFGRPWTWEERTRVLEGLDGAYRFYLYAPKGDPFLRRRWTETHPEAAADAVRTFAAACRGKGVAFGVGLSPFELHFDFNPDMRARLADKLTAIEAFGGTRLAVFFDDMRGDLTDLARRQAQIVDFIAARTRAERLVVCPSYYSDDPVLDRVFGVRPPGYLRELGAALDPAIDLMWTGEEVCSREFSTGRLERLAEEIGRAPVLWDNYPVNDGPRMSKRLHLRAFTGRPARNAAHLRGHAANPALQPTLSLIPLATLAAAYREGDAYAYGAAFRAAAREVCGEALAGHLEADLLALEDAGLGGLSPERLDALTNRYAAIDHPAAREVAAFLAGAYTAREEEVFTQ